MLTSTGLTVGAMLNGYQLIRLLGEGGTGSVFMAQQATTGQIVALKLLRRDEPDDAAHSARQVERFERETHLCARLHHPHIVRLLDKGQTGCRQLYAVFEFVPGETLKDLLLRKGALNASVSGELMGQVLDALVCAHAQGIAHRDLKPQNIMISTTGARAHVKVLDFGIAALIPERLKNGGRQMTMAEENLCSPAYSAPELLRGEPPTIKTDLYAWGLIFLECLTGKPAIEGATLAEIFHKQLSATDVPVPPALLGHPLADLLRRVLRKNPLERAGQATALYTDFQRINLATIAGDLHAQASGRNEPPHDPALWSQTQAYDSAALGASCQRQQLTVLCCTVLLETLAGNKADQERQEAMLRDLLSLCTDTAIRYGGHPAGALGSSQMFYFGYPEVADNDARRCAQTALDLISQVRRRAASMLQQGCKLDIRIAIHSGIALVQPGYLPSGQTADIALQLERIAAPGTVLVSAPARRLLDHYLLFEDTPRSIGNDEVSPLTYFVLSSEMSSAVLSLRRNGFLERQLVGREREFSHLQDAWQWAQHGHGRPLLIQGEAGIGKSRLAYELCMEVRRKGFLVVECRCLQEQRNNALHPFLDILRTHFELHPASHPEQAVARLSNALERSGSQLSWVLPILCSWLELPLPQQYCLPQLSNDGQKQILFDAFQKLILDIANGTPFLLLFEDIHWCDPTSAELLAQLSVTGAGHRMLLLMTCRPAEVPPLACTEIDSLELERLADHDSEKLITRLLQNRPVDPASLRRLCQRGDGIPLFVEELTLMLREKDLLTEQGGIYRLREEHIPADVPATLRELLSARLAHMGSARETAQLAAVIGREFEYALLADISNADEEALQTNLDRLIDADLLCRKRKVDGDSYLFKHALIVDAAYESLPRQVRQQMHARIARGLERGNGAQAERNLPQLARHFALATEFSEAIRYGARSALLSMQRALHDDAILLARDMQEWIAHLPATAQRNAQIETSQILTLAFMSKYGWADTRVKNNAEQALRLLELDDMPRHKVPALWSMALHHHVAGNRQMVRTLTNQLLHLSEQSQDRSLNVACQTMHGVGCWIDGDYQKAAQAFRQVLHYYDPVAHREHGAVFGMDSKAWAMAGLANVRWFMDTDGTGAFCMAHAAVEHARTLNHVPSLGVALMYLAFLHHYAQEREGAAAVSEQLLELARKYDLPAVESYAEILQCWSGSDLPRADRALSRLKQLGCMLGFTYVASLSAEIEARDGRHLEALARIDACLLACEEIDEHYYKPELLLRRALYRSQSLRPDHQASWLDLQQAMTLADAGGMQRTSLNARAQLYTLAAMHGPVLPQQAVPEANPN